MSADLASWLLEQIAEDERNVREIDDFDGNARESRAASGVEWINPSDRWDDTWRLVVPAERVLAECEAKRAIIEADADHPTARPYTDVNASRWNGWADCRDHTLRVLALPYADRPGYREEWRP